MQIDSATTALVTGGSRGIGLATGRALAARGVRVGLLARSRDGLEEAVASLRPSPAGDHLKLLADIGRGREVERAVERFVRQAGRLDLIVANAGIAHYGPFVGSDVEDAEEMVRVNVLGTIYTVRAALGPMLERRHGHVVVLSSGAGLRAFPGAAVYGGTKAFGRGFAEALRHELAGTGVGLTTVFPGEIATDLHAHERDLLPDWRKNEEELPPEPLAEAIVDAVAADRRRVFVPRVVGLLGINGVAPRLTDVLLAKIRGRSAAPRLD
ncbi:MAG TPA: SDR family oxidoreductase [Solirubrobacterales bacterium]|nr:SDR family oxidoreductase [Solirubrobacterales bacterium]